MLDATVTAAMARAATLSAARRDQSHQCGAAGSLWGHGQPGEATSQACLDVCGEPDLPV